MKNLRIEIKENIKIVVQEGLDILVPKKNKNGNIHISLQELMFSYQIWYSKTLPIVKQLLPERLWEFQQLYKLEKRDNKPLGVVSYTISDYLSGITVRNGFGKEVFDGSSIFKRNFSTQLAILSSTVDRIDQIITDIKGVLQSELFDNELDAAKELCDKGYFRSSGALAAVTLETHLAGVLEKHNIIIRKKNPTISDYNDTLKKNGIYDIEIWRPIQRLGDIRNYCVHHKEHEPTKEEVVELIEGVHKIIKTVF